MFAVTAGHGLAVPTPAQEAQTVPGNTVMYPTSVGLTGGSAIGLSESIRQPHIVQQALRRLTWRKGRMLKLCGQS